MTGRDDRIGHIGHSPIYGGAMMALLSGLAVSGAQMPERKDPEPSPYSPEKQKRRAKRKAQKLARKRNRKK